MDIGALYEEAYLNTAKDIQETRVIYTNDNIPCSVVKINNRWYRYKVEVLIFKGDKIFLSKAQSGGYRIPGGGLDSFQELESRAVAREAQEEAHINITNCRYSEIDYIIENGMNRKYANRGLPFEWKGIYVRVYLADYLSPYKGEVEKEDRDKDMISLGGYYEINQVYDQLYPAWQRAINAYKNIKESAELSGNIKFINTIDTDRKIILNYVKQTKAYTTVSNYFNKYEVEVAIDINTDSITGGIFVGNKGKDKGFIIELWVDEKHRREGIGYQLIDDAVRKLNGVDLIVKKNNTSAINLYTKYGFKVEHLDGTPNNYLYMKISKYSQGESTVLENSNDIENIYSYKKFKPLVDLFNQLKDYDYGIVVDGKKYVEDFDFSEYRTMSVKEFEKYKIGVCWDYAMYQERVLSKAYGKNNVQNLYFVLLNKTTCPTHTCTIVKIDGSYYMIEVAFWDYAGIEKYKSINEIINVVESRLRKFDNDNTSEISVYSYSATDKSIGLYCVDFMNYVAKSGKRLKGPDATINIPKEDLEESTIQEANISTELDKDFKSKNDMSLSSFTKMKLTDAIVQVYGRYYTSLSHIRINKDTEGYIWLDKNENVVAIINSEEKEDDTKWIISFEIFGSYKGHGLSKQILNVAVKDLKVTHLSVNKDNKVAIKIYKSYGFKEYKKTNDMIYMTVDKSSIDDDEDDDEILNEFKYKNSKAYKNPYLALKRKIGRRKAEQKKLGLQSVSTQSPAKDAPTVQAVKINVPTLKSSSEEDEMVDVAKKAKTLLEQEISKCDNCKYTYKEIMLPMDNNSYAIAEWNITEGSAIKMIKENAVSRAKLFFEINNKEYNMYLDNNLILINKK